VNAERSPNRARDALHYNERRFAVMSSERRRQMDAIYRQAQARPHGDRAAFVAEACAGDEMLRRDVEALLATPALETNVSAAPAPATASATASERTPSRLTGRWLGVYQLQEPIGAGGMGEVYRARDSRLDRDVAIKILSGEFAADPERLARFEREARMLAAFNHPNIATIHGTEETSLSGNGGTRETVRALVMELVDGDTLADRIGCDRLPAAEAVAIALQLADALDAAHSKGIVHRDLKPSNIMVTPTGLVKVLDFGLAKTLGAGPDARRLPTITALGARHGVALGTVAYMSPEQARGRPVDKRTDIWAFGCVLYEMLTGCAAFARETTPDTLAAILERDPEWPVLPVSTPDALTQLLRRCLEKDPQRRLRDVGDARFHLESALTDAHNAPSASTRARSDHDIQFQRLTDFPGMKESPAVSPDGKMIAFVALVGRRRQIWVRLIAGGANLPVTHDDVDHEQPRWAAESSTLIYYTPATGGEEGTIWEIGALGGTPRRIVSALGGGDISHDGRRIAILQASGDRPMLTTVTRDGAPAERIMVLPRGFTYAAPRWSPDGRAVALLRSSGKSWDMYLDVVSISDGHRHTVTRNAWLKGFCWLPASAGFLYSSARRSTLRYPLTFDLRVVERDGRNDRQLTFGDDSYVQPDARHAGQMVVARIRSRSDLWKIPVIGSPEENTRNAVRITRQTGQVQTPSVSPDEREIVYLSDSGGHGNLWIVRTDGSGARQLTFERDPEVGIGLPLWSPAGHTIVFVVDREGEAALWTIRPDGSHLRQVVSAAINPAWSPDGRWLYYLSRIEGAERIEKIPAEGGSPIVVCDEPGAEGPQVSEDGSMLYYASAVRSTVFGFWGGDREIRRREPQGGSSRVIGYVSAGQIPVTPGAHQIVLSPDGRWLATMLLDGATTNLWALPTAGGPMKPLTDFGGRSILIARHVSWSPDSEHLYAAVAEAETDIVLLDGLLSSS
jgi:serine/threonine protein kinase/Tol biopolymer transport system component